MLLKSHRVSLRYENKRCQEVCAEANKRNFVGDTLLNTFGIIWDAREYVWIPDKSLELDEIQAYEIV